MWNLRPAAFAIFRRSLLAFFAFEKEAPMNVQGLTGIILVLGSIVGCAPAYTPEPEPERVAKIMALEAESAARLVAEGDLLFRADGLLTGLDEHHSCWEGNGALDLLDEGELRQGIREASKALFLGEAKGADDLLALAKRDLAYAYSFSGHLDRAAQFAREAIAHTDLAPPEFARAKVLGLLYKILGDVRLRQGRPGEAIANYQQALVVGEGSLQPSIRSSMANAYLANGNPAKARQLFREAEARASQALKPLIRRGLGHVALAEGNYQEAVRWFTEAASQSTGSDQAYHRFWALEGLARARQGEGDRARAIKAYMQAIAVAEQIRARFRSEEFKTGFFGNIQRVFEEAITLLLEDGQADEAFKVSERSRSRALLDLVRDRVKLTVGATTFADPVNRVVTAAELQAALPEGIVAVEYHVLPRRTYVWVIRRSGIKSVAIEVGRETLVNEVRRFRESIRIQAPESLKIATDLYDRLVRPLELKGSEAIVIVPHDALHYMPFQALRGHEGYLIEERAISYLPSASLLFQFLTKEQRRMDEVLALGDPDLGTPRLALPGAQREVKEINTLFPNAHVYVRKEATKERLVNQAAQNHIVHIAAHAVVDEIDPLYSTIWLARTEKTPGKLEAHEVYRMDLSGTSLVTLSACETGLGRISGGDELWGFTRSFLSAGTRSLLVSLWSVSDESTARLMVRFYKEMQIKGIHQALRAAQLDLLHQARFSHPFFWAPFSLVGDWR